MWTDGGGNWDGTGVASVSTEGGKMSRGTGTRGVGCCRTKVGTAAGVSAYMNRSMGGYAWAGGGSDGIGTVITGVSVEVISASRGAGTGDVAHSHVGACIAATASDCTGERASVAGRSA